MTLKMPRKSMRVPRFLAPLARRIRDAERLIEKGIVVDSPSVKSNRQKDGRVELGLRQ
jgi:hypothetical protein